MVTGNLYYDIHSESNSSELREVPVWGPGSDWSDSRTEGWLKNKLPQ